MLADLARRDDVIAFDLFGDLDLRAARVVKRRSLTALVDAAVAEAPGAVVYGASFENHPGLVERLAERHRLLGNPAATLRAVRDPVRLGAALGELPYPRTTVDGPVVRPLAAQAAARRRRDPRARVARRRAAAPGRSCRSASTGCRARRRRWATGRTPSCSGSPSSSSGGASSASAATAGAGTSYRRERRCRGTRRRRSAPVWRPRSACAGCSASTSCGTASARGRWRSTRVRPRRSRRSRRRTACGSSSAPEVVGEPVRAAGKAVLFATEDVVDRRQRALAGARRARRPAPGRAHRRGPPDLHDHDDRRHAAGRPGGARGAGRGAARGAARGGGGGWLTRRAWGAAASATTSS